MVPIKSLCVLFLNFFDNLPKYATQYGFSIILALAFLAAPLSAQEAKSGKKADQAAKTDKAAKADKKEKSETDDPGGVNDIPVLEGQPVAGLEFPYYDEADGKLKMTLTADLATKIDPTHIELKNMKINAVGDDGKSFHVELPFSIFEIPERVLTGDKGVLIKRDDFILTGDAGEFYLKTRFAKVLKNVKMIIYSLPSDTPAPTPSPTPKKEIPAKS